MAVSLLPAPGVSLRLGAGLLVLAGAAAMAGQDTVAIEAGQINSSVFSGAKSTLEFTVRSNRAFQGRILWQLATDGRVTARGESKVSVEPGSPGKFELSLNFPVVKSGVILPLVLTLTARREGDSTAAARYEKHIWVFPEDPFADRAKQLRQLRIVVFDPEGKTAAVLQKADIPFDETRNPSALPELDARVAIIGEGVSLDDYPDLAEVMFDAAAKGKNVLCLALAQGAAPFPGMPGKTPSRLTLANEDVLARFDKRFDTLNWGGGQNSIASRVALKVHSGQVAVGAAKDNGWPWMDAEFGATGGRFVHCGFGMIRSWDANPTPRHLLAAILDSVRLTNRAQAPEAQAQEKER